MTEHPLGEITTIVLTAIEDLLGEGEIVTNRAIRERTGLTIGSVGAALRPLKRYGFIRQVGRLRNTHWRLPVTKPVAVTDADPLNPPIPVTYCPPCGEGMELPHYDVGQKQRETNARNRGKLYARREEIVARVAGVKGND